MHFGQRISSTKITRGSEITSTTVSLILNPDLTELGEYIVTIGRDRDQRVYVAIIKAEERPLGLLPILRGIVSTVDGTSYFVLDDRDIHMYVNKASRLMRCRGIIQNWTKCWNYIIEVMEPKLRNSLRLDIVQSPYFDEAYLNYEKATTMKVGGCYSCL